MEIQRQTESFAYRVGSIKLSAYSQRLLDKLNSEFNEWYQANPHPITVDSERGPIGHWPHIESFLADRYPEAYRGFSSGMEEAGCNLDPLLVQKGWGVRPNTRRYEHGQRAVKEYGYDPSEIVAGMLLLHNRSHPQRDDLEYSDIKRLNDIAKKRHQMQEDYEKRKQLVTAATMNFDLAEDLAGEFDDWYEQNKEAQELELMPERGGPLGSWENIEKFFKDRYPAAYQGFTKAYEQAPLALDYNGYDTGPEAIAKHGYDPLEVAASMFYLHNQTDGARKELRKTDEQRIIDVMRKRHEMQNRSAAKDLVNLYHWTTPEIAEKIEREGFSSSGSHPHYPGMKNPIWFSEYPDDDFARENVTGTDNQDLVQVAVQVPRHLVEPDYFADDVADVGDSSGWRVVDLDNLAGLPAAIHRQNRSATRKLAKDIVLYRGFGLDFREPGMEKIKAITHPHFDAVPGESLVEAYDRSQKDEAEGVYDHPDLGPHILDYLSSGRGPGGYTLGSHWTPDISVAQDWSRHRGRTPVVLKVRIPGDTKKKTFNPGWKYEKEWPMPAGTPVNVEEVHLWNPRDVVWHNVLQEPSVRYASMDPILLAQNMQTSTFAYRLAEKSFDYTLVDRLEGEFNDWAKKNNITNPSDLSWAPRGPIGHWPNIELFLKNRYPAAHRNLAMGDELSRPLMDRGETPKYRHEKDQHPPRANPAEESLNVPYETGPEALAKYGYDPKEITAAMLLLHDDSHIGRTLLKRDQNRLNDIARKRHKMQEAFEMAHHAIRLAENTIRKIAADLVR